jgi:hypothetical protein
VPGIDWIGTGASVILPNEEVWTSTELSASLNVTGRVAPAEVKDAESTVNEQVPKGAAGEINTGHVVEAAPTFSTMTTSAGLH